MKHIKIINTLILTSDGVVTKYKNGKTHDFFIKQGCLDVSARATPSFLV